MKNLKIEINGEPYVCNYFDAQHSYEYVPAKVTIVQPYDGMLSPSIPSNVKKDVVFIAANIRCISGGMQAQLYHSLTNNSHVNIWCNGRHYLECEVTNIESKPPKDGLEYVSYAQVQLKTYNEPVKDYATVSSVKKPSDTNYVEKVKEQFAQNMAKKEAELYESMLIEAEQEIQKEVEQYTYMGTSKKPLNTIAEQMKALQLEVEILKKQVKELKESRVITITRKIGKRRIKL